MADEALEQAYRATTYWVETPDEWIPLRVGRTSERLDALLAARGVSTWAFLTSDNPGSRRLRPAENESRRRALEAALDPAAILPGLGVGDPPAEPDAEPWPPERSFLVLGIGREEAMDLARRQGQKAILFGTRGGPAELVFC